MQHRLFIAVDLPDELRRRLARMVAGAPSGVRPVPAGQIHLTLHFLGDADDAALAALAAALSRVRAQAFAIDLEGVGVFPPRGRPAVLWAGVGECDSLRRLHREIADIVANCGFVLEPRPWVPHVTLARLAPHAPRSWTAAFLDRHAGLSAPGVAIEAFRLYESTRLPEGTVHAAAATVGLSPEDGGEQRENPVG